MREILAYLSIKYNGDWDKIYQAITNKEQVNKEEVKKVVSELNVDFIDLLDERYPQILKQVYKPPFVLFYKGDLNLLNKKIIAITGADESDTTASNVRLFVNGLNNSDMVVANMLNTTIDFRVASEVKTQEISNSITITDYVNENIETKGLIVSERYNKPTQITSNEINYNARLLSGLCSALLVMDIKDNNYNTTKYIIKTILENDREIFAIPGSKGCNALIKEGACLCDCVEDILMEV